MTAYKMAAVRSPHIMTTPRPNKVTYGCYPFIPHALRFTKGGKGLIPNPVYLESHSVPPHQGNVKSRQSL
jgi:hypothetical protein